MDEFKQLVEMGRKFGPSKRGALIQLEGNTVYLTNERRSLLLKISSKELGTGTFYASEAPVLATRIERRGEKVYFEWGDQNKKVSVFVPDKPSIKESAEAAIEKLFKKPEIKIQKDVFDIINPDMLITTISVEGNILSIKQTRSDGSVGFHNNLNLDKGLLQVKYDYTGEVSFFTSDLLLLRDFTKFLTIHIERDSVISIEGELTFGKFIGLISNLKYEGGG